MPEPFAEMLRGASNTLGRTEEVVAVVFENPDRASEVFDLFWQHDEWIRLRANSVLKRLWRSDPTLIKPFISRWVDEVARIEQPSVQWTFAQLFEECPALFEDDQRVAAIGHLRGYLESSEDWMVLNSAVQTLSGLATSDLAIREFLLPHLHRLSKDDRKSVSRRATKALGLLETPNG